MEVPSSFPIPHVLAGRYEIRSKLGEGGMSEVWHAFDLYLRMDVARVVSS